MGVDRRHTVKRLVSRGADHDRQDTALVGFGDFNGQETCLTVRTAGRQTDFSCGAQPIKAAATREKEKSQSGKASFSSADRVVALSPDNSGFQEQFQIDWTRESLTDKN